MLHHVKQPKQAMTPCNFRPLPCTQLGITVKKLPWRQPHSAECLHSNAISLLNYILLSSLANRSVHAVQWSSSCVLWRAAGPGWAWRSSWRGSVATSRVPSGRRKKASASGVAARRTHPLAATHLLKKTITATRRYWLSDSDPIWH